jgi:hypothetical protein
MIKGFTFGGVPGSLIREIWNDKRFNFDGVPGSLIREIWNDKRVYL